MDLLRACDGLFPLPVKEKAIMESDKHEMFMDLATLAMAFSPCLSRKRPSLELDKHNLFMDWASLCDGLFSLPVEEKAIMESDKHELLMVVQALTGLARSRGTKRNRPFSSTGTQKTQFSIHGGSTRDGLFPLPVEENAISGLPYRARALTGCPG